jgi:DNA-binding LacI/PurR family transcriptional regulator
MTTIADVARVAGVGVGTASRVLNGSPHVSEPTRERVQAAIKELNYRQTRGPAVRPRPRRQIGVLVPFFDQPATYQRLQALVRRLQPHGYDVVVLDVDSPIRARERLYELPRHPHLAGLVVLSLPLGSDDGHHLAQAPFPTVALDTWHPALSGVQIDDLGGGRMAANYMLSLGHRRIAFLGEPRRNPFGFASSAKREDGFKAALHAAGIGGRTLTRHGPHRRAAARHLALELLRLPDRPTAIVAGSDVQAIGVLDAARDLNIDVPGELSVIGYDDIDLASHLDISTMRQPLAYSGERSADMLLDALANPTDAQVHIEELSVEVIARNTTGPVPVETSTRGRRKRASA